MKLLLLGCSGFIGKQLVPELIEEGHEVTVVSRKKQLRFDPIGKNVKLTHLQLDPSLISSWKDQRLLEFLKISEGIINLAGEPIAEKRWTKKQCRTIKNSRLNTTKFLISTISRLKVAPKVLVNGSAIGIYGTSLNNVFNEESKPGIDFLANLCKEWELLASEKPSSTRLVILRLGIVLEKDGGALGKMLPVFSTGFGGPLGTGLQWMSWIHRDDVCKIVKNALINKNWHGVINAVAPNPERMISFTKILGKSTNRPTLLKVPEFILQLLLGDGAKVVLEGQKVTSTRLNKLGYKFNHSRLDEAMESIVSNKYKRG